VLANSRVVWPSLVVPPVDAVEADADAVALVVYVGHSEGSDGLFGPADEREEELEEGEAVGLFDIHIIFYTY